MGTSAMLTGVGARIPTDRAGSPPPCPLCGAAGKSEVMHILDCSRASVWPQFWAEIPPHFSSAAPQLVELLFLTSTARHGVIAAFLDCIYLVAARHRLTEGT